MTRGYRWLASLLMLSLSLCLLGTAGRAAEPTEGAEPTAEYRYVLELNLENQPVGAAAGCTWVELWVACTDPAAPALHTGSVALGVENTAALGVSDFTFLPESDDYAVTALTGGEESMEKGTAADSGVYLGFVWYAQYTVEPKLDEEGRQLLGKLQLPYGKRGENVTAQDIRVVPWPQTATGSDILKQLAGADEFEQENLNGLMENSWRIPDEDYPNVGYYQGFYRSDDGRQMRVDIQAPGGAFRLISYDPKDPVVLSLYPALPEGGYSPTAAYRMELPGAREGVGRCAKSIDFEKGTYLQGPSGTVSVPASSLPVGKYRLLIQKQSHVSAQYTGVSVTANALFPELAGVTLTLPCGDVNGDGAVRQLDRALLTAPSRYGRAATKGETYDLDGDGRVDQRDLAILTAPANYGRSNLHFEYGVDGE